MRHLLAATVVGITLVGAQAALCADAAVYGLPPGPPPYGAPPPGPPPLVNDIAVPTLFYFWNGPYLGLHGGWGWTTTKGLNSSGDFGGGQLGYNYQTGNFVLGVEADGSFAHISSDDVTIPLFVPSTTVGYQENGLASLRARFGVAMNGILFYGTAGGGWVHSRATNTVVTTIPGPTPLFPGATDALEVTQQAWKGGWTAGAGVEYGFLPNWSVKVEYLHFGTGNTTYFSAFNTGNVNVETFRIGVNYLFR